MTPPDFAWNGLKAVRELQEVRSLVAVDRTNARAAESLAGRSARADRAARYQQIVERANLRSPIRAEQIAASPKLEMAPRVAAAGGTSLLIREEVVQDEPWVRVHARRLAVQLAAVHK